MATASRAETGQLKGYFKTNRILETYPTGSYASQYQLITEPTQRQHQTELKQ
jgi:hypothetical protein